MNDDDDIQTYELLSHATLMPVRDLMPEQVFNKQWQLLMQTQCTDRDEYDGPENGYYLSRILQNMRGSVTERQSRVCASIITWLGTNCGCHLLSEARKFQSAPALTDQAQLPNRNSTHRHLIAWTMNNQRASFVNGGIRSIELICACATELEMGDPSFRSQVPELSIEDYETAEHLMRWLSSNAGEAFLSAAERKIRVHQVAERKKLSAHDLAELGVQL